MSSRLPLLLLPGLLCAAVAHAQTATPTAPQTPSPSQSAPQAAAPPASPPAAQPASPPAPDKSGYTLFNPTPDADLRAFSTDRPNKSSSSYTVDAGHYQIETDLVNGTFFHSRGTTVRSYVVADPVLKAGLTNNVDLEVSIGGYNHIVTTGAGVSGGTASGYGDTVVRLKWNLFGNDGGDYALAVIPYVKAPTARIGVGNGQTEEGVLLPFSANLPYGFSAVVMTELDVLKNGSNNGRHLNSLNLINVSHTIFGNLTGSVEFASQFNGDHGSTNSSTADFALSYALTPTIQLDTAAYAGLNRDAPRLTLYSGISARF